MKVTITEKSVIIITVTVNKEKLITEIYLVLIEIFMLLES